MPKFRKKPVVIDAVQWNGMGMDLQSTPDWLFEAYIGGQITRNEIDRTKLLIETSEGSMTASPNDWIIKGVKGELYPCKPDIFDATYDRVEEALNASTDSNS